MVVRRRGYHPAHGRGRALRLSHTGEDTSQWMLDRDSALVWYASTMLVTIL